MTASTSARREPHALTRRGFLRLTMGSLTLLPSVASALMLPDLALAEGETAELVNGAEVYVVRPSEVGLVVRDVSKSESSQNAIKGAHVKVTSRFNGQSVEGTTDDKGGIVFDIAALSEDESKAATPAGYAFNGTIEVDAPGYRRFRTGLYRVQGGVAIAVPTQPLVQGVPYPVSVSFDEWDVLYTTNEFVASASNDMRHSIAVALEGCAAGSVTGALLADGKQVGTASANVAPEGTTTLVFDGMFLLEGSAEALPAGESHGFAVRYTSDGTTYEVPIKPQVANAAPGVSDVQTMKDLQLVPFDDTSMFVGVSIPESWPIIGGFTFKMWSPDFPVIAAANPFGYLMIKVSTPDWGYKSDNGKPDDNAWKFHPRKTCQEQFDKIEQDIGDAIDRTEAAFAKDGKVRQVELSRKLSFTARLELMVALKWSDDYKETRGRAALQLRVGAAYSITESFLVGPIPLYIGFSVGLNATAAGEAGVLGKAMLDFHNYRWDYSSTGFDLQLAFRPTLSVGVGIAGVASVSVKGTLSLTFYLHAGPLPEGYKDLPTPHLRLSFQAAVTVEIEFVLFSKSIKLCNVNKPDVYNNWEKKNDLLEDYVNPTEGLSLAETLEDAQIVTADALAQLVEFETSGPGELLRQETYHAFLAQETGEDGIAQEYQIYLSDEDLSAIVAEGSAQRDASGAIAGTGSLLNILCGMNGGRQGYDAAASFALRPAEGSLELCHTSAPAATPYGCHGYQVAPIGAAAGVSALGRAWGIRPSTDIKLADNILSDARPKLIRFYSDGRYITGLLRLAVVLVGGQPRTRLVIEEIGCDLRGVIDFGGQERNDFFDYDFDADAFETEIQGLRVGCLLVAVMSGKRANGDATTLATAMSDTVVASVLVTVNYGRVRTSTSTTLPLSEVNASGADQATYPHRFYSCPQVRNVNGPLMQHITFLERAAMTPEELLGTDPARTKVGVGLLCAITLRPIIRQDVMDMMRSAVSAIGDASLIEVTMLAPAKIQGGSVGADMYEVLMLRGTSSTHYVMVGSSTGFPKWVEMVDPQQFEDPQTRLVPSGVEGEWLANVNGRLARASWTVEGATPHVSLEDMGLETLETRGFGVTAHGNLVVWPALRKGGVDYRYDEDGNVVESPEEELYQLRAMRVRGGKASRSFVLAELEHPVDTIQMVGEGIDQIEFTSSASVDAARGRGELWYTSVPYVRCATIVYADPVVDVVARGDRLPFFVTLRNDGNTFLSGVDLEVSERGGDDIGTISLDFSEGSTLESEWNPRGEDGRLQNVEDDWALAPGATSRYYVGSVTIPDTWEGKKELEVKVTALREPSANELGAMADAHVIDYLHDEHAGSLVRVNDGLAGVENGDMLSAADVIVGGSPVNPVPTPPDGWVRPTPGTGQPAQATSRSGLRRLPDTGEGALGAASGLVALGGAALAAYGKRRADVEREEREKKSDR